MFSTPTLLRKKPPRTSNASDRAFRRSKPGFTLIEIVVALVVLALLAAIALVGFGHVTHDAAIAADQRSVQNALTESYALAAQNTRTMPSLDDVTIGFSDMPGASTPAPGSYDVGPYILYEQNLWDTNPVVPDGKHAVIYGTGADPSHIGVATTAPSDSSVCLMYDLGPNSSILATTQPTSDGCDSRAVLHITPPPPATVQVVFNVMDVETGAAFDDMTVLDASSTVIASDDFNRADGALTSQPTADWHDATPGMAAPHIHSNGLTGDDYSPHIAWVNAPDAPLTAQATIGHMPVPDPENQMMQIGVGRISDGVFDAFVMVAADGDAMLGIHRPGGDANDFIVGDRIPVAAGDTVALERVGAGTWRAWHNGVVFATRNAVDLAMVSGTVSNSSSLSSCVVHARANALSINDFYEAPVDGAGNFNVWMFGGETTRLEAVCPDGSSFFGGPDYASATPITPAPGSTTIGQDIAL